MEASIFEQLAAPIEKENVKRKRVPYKDKKTGEMKSYEADYITARTVMNRLDRVVGPENWSDDYIDRAGGSVRCILSIRIAGEWISKSDVGTETDIEGVKGSYSEAFKRAAVKWGIGRELYDEGTAYEPAPSKGGGAATSRPPQQNAKQSTPKPSQAPAKQTTPDGSKAKWPPRPWQPETVKAAMLASVANKPTDLVDPAKAQKVSIVWKNITGQDDKMRHRIASYMAGVAIVSFKQLSGVFMDAVHDWLTKNPPLARQEAKAIADMLLLQDQQQAEKRELDPMRELEKYDDEFA